MQFPHPTNTHGSPHRATNNTQHTIQNAKRKVYTLLFVLVAIACIPPVVVAFNTNNDHAWVHFTINSAVLCTCGVLIMLSRNNRMITTIERMIATVATGYVLTWDIFNLITHRYPIDELGGEAPIILVGLIMILLSTPRDIASKLAAFILITHLTLKWFNISQFTKPPGIEGMIVSDLVICMIAILVTLLIPLSTAALQAAQESDEYRTLAHTDPVTNLLNQRGLTKSISDAPNKTLIGIEVGPIAHLNLLTGQHNADQILNNVAGVISTHTPPDAALARTGGEMFVMALPQEKATAAHHIAADCAHTIANLNVTPQLVACTAVVTVSPHDTAANAILRVEGETRAVLARDYPEHLPPKHPTQPNDSPASHQSP